MIGDRIAIGAVQFGLPYGIANNSHEKTSLNEASNILNYAKSIGINSIDTAISYGESESSLGIFGVSSYKVITKLPAIPNNCHNVKHWVDCQLKESLLRLKLSRVYALLLHSPNDLDSSKGHELWSALQSLQQKKTVQKIGYSVYKPEDLDRFYREFPPELVQAPYNIFDQRLASSGWLERLSNAKTEIHVRSVFLQGLLLMPSHERPSKFDRWQSVFEKFDLWLKDNDISALQASICFAIQDPRITKVIIGVDNLLQLKEIVSNMAVNKKIFPDELSIKDIDLIDPSRWNLL